MSKSLQCSRVSSTSQATSRVIPPGLAPYICQGMSFSSHSAAALYWALSYPTVHTEKAVMGLCSSARDLFVSGRRRMVQYCRGCGHSPPSETTSMTFCLAVKDMLCNMCASAVRHPSVPPDLSFCLLLIQISNPFS